ncbi:hypothetical protein ACFONG_09865 [Uliginosibacterium paludis]|uniref:Lipoprotein n=1 Tax=Uliginosibacterium paludis TaxID=1615952 RepID=A0ABV2CMT6_9RHOO
MNRFLIIMATACLLGLAGCGELASRPAPAWQRVSLERFFNGLTVPVSLSIRLPGDFVLAGGIDAPVSHAYWMRPADVAKMRETRQLPADAAYLFGNMAPPVRFDRASGKFSGEDQLRSQLAAAGVRLLDQRKWQANGLPVLAIKAVGSDGRPIQVVYIATLADSYCLYITLRPAAGDAEGDERLWQQGALSIE